MTADKLATLLLKELSDLRLKKVLEMENGLSHEAYQKHVEYCKALKDLQAIIKQSVEKLRAENR